MLSHNLSLKLIQRCPACNAAFNQARVRVIAESDNTVLAHLSCGNCNVSLLANVVQTKQGLVGNAILVDAGADEVEAYLDNSNMSEDDFLQIYELIHNNKLLIKLKESSKYHAEDDEEVLN